MFYVGAGEGKPGAPAAAPAGKAPAAGGKTILLIYGKILASLALEKLQISCERILCNFGWQFNLEIPLSLFLSLSPFSRWSLLSLFRVKNHNTGSFEIYSLCFIDRGVEDIIKIDFGQGKLEVFVQDIHKNYQGVHCLTSQRIHRHLQRIFT